MNIELYLPVIPCFMLSIAGFLVIFNRKHSNLTKLSFSIAFLVSATIGVLWIISTYFTGAGIDESVIFHIQQGIVGAGLIEYRNLALVSGLILTAAVVMVALLARQSPDTALPVRNGWLAPGLAALSLLMHPGGHDLVRLGIQMSGAVTQGTNDQPADLVLQTETASLGPGKNLIFLYLEGLEQTYLDETLFPELVPNLLDLAATGIRHDGVKHVYADTWTIGGITASQCGIPLLTPSGGNTMEGLDKFLPGIQCMGDILAEVGYRLEYIGGASLDFAGKGTFLRTHGFASVEGRHELADRAERGYMTGWGLYDDTLLEIALDKISALENSNVPYGFFALTLDTHHPQGHPSRRCLDRPYGDGSNPILNAVHCSDFLVGEFVDELRHRGFLDDTVLVLASDHLAMRNTAWTLLNRGERKNLFIEIHPDKEPGINRREASLFDIGPTVLSSLGLDVPAVGYGRDLNRAARTLRETNPDFPDSVRAASPFLLSLWNFPSARFGFTVDPASGTLELGDRRIQGPALLLLDESLNVPEIHLGGHLPLTASGLPSDTGIVWFDDCWRVSALNGHLATSDSEHYCIGITRIDRDTTLIIEANQRTGLRPAEIREALESGSPDPGGRDQRVERLQSVHNLFSWTPREQVLPTLDASAGNLVIGSLGGNTQGRSYVLNENLAFDDRRILQRGVSVVALTNDGDVRLIKRFDTCKGYDPDAAEPPHVISDVIDRMENPVAAVAIVVHDSAACPHGSSLETLFAGSPFQRWNEIGYRQPYIGIIGPDAEPREHVGPREGRLVLRLRGTGGTGSDNP